MASEILMSSLGIGTIAAVTIVAIKNAARSSFLYANARMASKDSLTNEKLAGLADNKTLSGLINQLKDTDYSLFLESVDKDNLAEFSMAIEKGFIQSINELKNLSPKKWKVVFEAWVKIYEAKIIKTFFRSRHSNITIDESLLEPIGSINPELLTRLRETKTLADMKLVLANTSYSTVMEEEHGSIEQFDIAIEEKVRKDIEKLVSAKRYKDVAGIFKIRQDIRKILMLLKFRIRKKEEYLKNYPDSLEEFIGLYKGTELYKPLSLGLAGFNATKNYFMFERELLRHFRESVSSPMLVGPYPIIAHVVLKEIEQKNLFILAKGISEGIPRERLKEMII